MPGLFGGCGIAHGSLIFNLEEADEVPERFARFITQKSVADMQSLLLQRRLSVPGIHWNGKW